MAVAATKGIVVSEFGDASVMKFTETPPLPALGKDEVLVSVAAAGVNPVDTYIRAGVYALKPQLPYTPGKDGAGVVKAVGDGVANIKAGDRVYIVSSVTGTYAEEAICAKGDIFPLPDNVTFEEGAALGIPFGTAHRALVHRARATEGETLLIHGSTGGVGTAALQLAKALGLRVVATAGTEEGMELLRRLGADKVANHREEDSVAKVLTIAPPQVDDLTEGQGLDIVIEMLANVNLGKDLTMLAKGGRVVVVGSRGPVEINPRDLMQREAEVKGVMLGLASEEEKEETYTAITTLLGEGKAKPVIGQVFDINDAPKAHEEVISHSSGSKGKIVLRLASPGDASEL